MPCGKGQLVHFAEDAASAAPTFTQRVKDGTWFGFAEVDIEIPQHLRHKFEEMSPFINKEVPAEAVPQHMLDYLKKTGRTFGVGKKLLGALSAEKMLVYAPLLRWYVSHGAVIKSVHRTIDYQPKKIFTWFVEQVTEARPTGDVEKGKALLAEVFQLLGNSAYGKMIATWRSAAKRWKML